MDDFEFLAYVLVHVGFDTRDSALNYRTTKERAVRHTDEATILTWKENWTGPKDNVQWLCDFVETARKGTVEDVNNLRPTIEVSSIVGRTVGYYFLTQARRECCENHD